MKRRKRRMGNLVDFGEEQSANKALHEDHWHAEVQHGEWKSGRYVVIVILSRWLVQGQRMLLLDSWWPRCCRRRCATQTGRTDRQYELVVAGVTLVLVGQLLLILLALLLLHIQVVGQVERRRWRRRE